MLVVTTRISMGVVIINKSCSVKWLMNISNVMDDKSESKRLLICQKGECCRDLLVVSSCSVIASLSEEVSQSIESLNIVFNISNKSRVISNGFAFLVNVRLVNEMPSRLPFVTQTLDHISKSSTFNERVTSFTFSDIRVVSFKVSKHVNSSSVCSGVLNLQKIVSSSCS